MATTSYFLVPTNYTRSLARSPPFLGRNFAEVMKEQAEIERNSSRLRGILHVPEILVPEVDSFVYTSWRALQHMLVYRLAKHSARVSNRHDAALCIVAVPQRPFGSKDLWLPIYTGGPTPGPDVLAAHECASNDYWQQMCPGRALALIDVPDVDYRGWRPCEALWDRCHPADARLLRVSGGPPYTGKRASFARCPHVTVPWLAHTHSPRAARTLAAMEAAGTHKRKYVVVGAFSTWGHGFTAANGWGDWRRRLRNACTATPVGEDGQLRMCRWNYQAPNCKEWCAMVGLTARDTQARALSC